MDVDVFVNGIYELISTCVDSFAVVGTGKTTFIRLLAGLLKPDNTDKIPILNVSYKPQKIAPKFEGTVRQLLHSKIRATYIHPQVTTTSNDTRRRKRRE